MIMTKYGLGFLALILLLSVGTESQAASLYINPATTEIRPGDTIALQVRVDPGEDECINVVNGVIEYDPLIQPVDISRGRSILPIWVEEPTIDAANNRITFAGGIPNGYCGRIEGDPRLTNTVLELVFQAPGFRIGMGEVGPTSTIRFSEETSVLLNDGRGTAASLETFGAEIFVHKRPGNTTIDEWNSYVSNDFQLPEEFSISLNQDDSIFGGKFFIVFNTTDKQTGIDHYEIIEEPLENQNLFGWGAVDAPWVEARSPYLLTDQSLNSTIRVKAVDKAGNEYIAVFVPPADMRSTSLNDQILLGAVISLAVLVMVVVLGVFVYRRRLRTREEQYEEEYEEYDEDE